MAGKTGEGVDSAGNPVIDPTKNVETLVKALEDSTEKLRAADALLASELRKADAKFQDAMRDADARYRDALREAETRRIDQLASLRVQYDIVIEGMRSKSLETTSTLLATQLREVKLDLSDRTAKLEQFRWESGGKTGGQSQVISWVISAAAVTFAVVVFLLNKPGG